MKMFTLVSGIIWFATIFVGCATVKMESLQSQEAKFDQARAFEQARAKDTFDSYAYFLKEMKEKYGKFGLDLRLVCDARERMIDIFITANIKKIEVMCLCEDDNRYQYQLYEKTKDQINNILKKKGYSVQSSDKINTIIVKDILRRYRDSPLNDRYESVYYRMVKPFLDGLQKPDVDAILLFVIYDIGKTGSRTVGYRWDPTAKRYFYDQTTFATPGDALGLSYHVFDLKWRERVIAEAYYFTREFKEELIGKTTYDGPGNYKIISKTFSWDYTKTYDDFLTGSIIWLFANFPDRK